MIQIIGIPVGSDPVPFFENLFLAHKEADWVKEQRKLMFETIIHFGLSMTCCH